MHRVRHNSVDLKASHAHFPLATVLTFQLSSGMHTSRGLHPTLLCHHQVLLLLRIAKELRESRSCHRPLILHSERKLQERLQCSAAMSDPPSALLKFTQSSFALGTAAGDDTSSQGQISPARTVNATLICGQGLRMMYVMAPHNVFQVLPGPNKSQPAIPAQEPPPLPKLEEDPLVTDQPLQVLLETTPVEVPDAAVDHDPRHESASPTVKLGKEIFCRIPPLLLTNLSWHLQCEIQS